MDDSHCFSGGNNLLSEMGNRKYAKFPLGRNLYWRRDTTTLRHFFGGVYSVDCSSMFISVHVGATSALLCAREGKQHS